MFTRSRAVASCALLALASEVADAGQYVTMPSGSYGISRENLRTGSSGGSAGSFFSDRDSFDVVREAAFFNAEPIANRYAGTITGVAPDRDRLVLESEVFSVFEPSFVQTDRFGRETTIPDTFHVSNMTAGLDLRLEEAAIVEMRVVAEPLQGTPRFWVDFGGREAVYGVDAATGVLTAEPTMTPDPNDSAPDAVLDQQFVFQLPAGVHVIRTAMESAIGPEGQLLHGAYRVVVDFIVPEPVTTTLLACAGVGLVVRRPRASV